MNSFKKKALDAIRDAYNQSLGEGSKNTDGLLEAYTVVFGMDDTEEVPYEDYEYAVQYTFGRVVRHIPESSWTPEESARQKLKDGKTQGTDATWGPWTAKIVKRRKAGKVEDA